MTTDQRGSEKLRNQLEAILAALAVVPLEEPTDVVYGEVRAELERAGTPIGGNDLLIAAHALTLGCTVVTANVREFARIEGLRVENWLDESPTTA